MLYGGWSHYATLEQMFYFTVFTEDKVLHMVEIQSHCRCNIKKMFYNQSSCNGIAITRPKPISL